MPVSPTRRRMYRRFGKRSLCRGKSIRAPNKCKKFRNCKVASGKVRSYCRKKKATRYTKRKR